LPAILQTPTVVAAGLVAALALPRADGRGERISLIEPQAGQ
jgi:hypothetical protein